MERLASISGRGALAVAVALLAVVGTTLSGPPAQGASTTLSPVPLPALGFSGHAGLYGWGAATMRDGSVLVGDYWNQRVLRLNPDGSLREVFIDQPGFAAEQHQSPYGLAVDPDNGDVYLADTDRRQVDRYSEEGAYLASYGTNGVPGETSTTFRYPSRVAAHDGLVVIADTWANRISVWRRDGTEQLFEQKGFGSGPGEFRQPRGMAFDDQGRLHVVDSGNRRIQVFSVDAAQQRLVFLYAYGSAYVAADPVAAPGAVFRGDLRGLAIDQASDVVYVVDGEGNRVHAFSTDGTWLRTWGGATTFSDGGREVTVDHAGKVWVGDMPSFRVQVFSPEGQHLFDYPRPAQPPPPGGFNGPRGSAVDPATGNVFVSDTYNFRLQKLAPDGTMLTQWGARGRADYEFNYARLIAVDPLDSAVVVADTDNHRIKKYDANGTFLWQVGAKGTGDRQFANPHGVDVGPDGTIYVADSNNARVQVLTRDGSFVRAFGSLGGNPGQFRRPRGIVSDDVTGSIYVADSIRDNVQVFTENGTYLRTIGGPGSTPVPMEGPFDVAVDADYLYVADTPRNMIVVFTKDGQWVGDFGGGGSTPGKLLQPQGLDLVGDVLYITEQQGERVSRWKLYKASTAGDTTAPSLTVRTPTPSQVFSARPVLMSGTVGDAVAVGQVQTAVRDRVTRLWWSPGLRRWQATQAWDGAALDAPTTTRSAWRWSFSDATARGSGSYLLQSRALDVAGNVSPVSSVVFDIR